MTHQRSLKRPYHGRGSFAPNSHTIEERQRQKCEMEQDVLKHRKLELRASVKEVRKGGMVIAKVEGGKYHGEQFTLYPEITQKLPPNLEEEQPVIIQCYGIGRHVIKAWIPRKVRSTSHPLNR